MTSETGVNDESFSAVTDNKKFNLIHPITIVLGLLFLASSLTGFVIHQRIQTYQSIIAIDELVDLMGQTRLSQFFANQNKQVDSTESFRNITDKLLLKMHQDITLIQQADTEEKRQQITESIAAYRKSFFRYVEAKKWLKTQRVNMLHSAAAASETAEKLQKNQEEHIQLYTENISKLRLNVAVIGENSANSSAVVLAAGQILQYINQILLYGDTLLFNQINTEVDKLRNITQTLEHRVANQHSQFLLNRIDASQLLVQDMLALLIQQATRQPPLKETELVTKNRKILHLIQLAESIKDLAIALHNNEQKILTDLKHQVVQNESQLARHVLLSQAVNDILQNVNLARQRDKDYALATTKEARETIAKQLYTSLSKVQGKVNTIQSLLNQSDKKLLFVQVLANINKYRKNFSDLKKITAETVIAQQLTKQDALQTEQLLRDLKGSSVKQISSNTFWLKVLIPLCFLTFVSVAILIFLLKRSISTMPVQPASPPLDKSIALKKARHSSPELVIEAEITVMIVEDNHTNQQILLRQLEALGYTAQAYDNGKEALLALQKQHSYRLILTDCNMPEMDGYAFTEAVRRMEKSVNINAIPIIAITADDLPSAIERCYEAGMDDYLSKPLDLEKLKLMLHHYCAEQTVLAPLNDTAKPVFDSQKNTPIVDLSYLRASFGDDEALLREILLDFSASANDIQTQLNLSFQQENFKSLADQAHKLKSSSRAIGAEQLAQHCGILEQAYDLEENKIEATVKEINTILQDVLNYIKRF